MADKEEQGAKLERTETLAPTAMLAGKYRLGRLIGEGGMGAVYEAEHTGLGARVAVKLLGEGTTADNKAITRFKREALAMGQIRHDNVVRVMDTGVDHLGLPYLVMELLDGETLSSVLRREKTLDPNVAVEITAQILSGLAAAHDQGVVHRDLKPGNIFIANESDGAQRVKILDFGISKLHDSTTHNVTAEGALVGTPNFMAPEQISGDTDQDIRIDVYAVGVLLYRMLCGSLPFVAKQADDLYRKILAASPTPPSEHRPEISPELEQIVLKAMAPKPDNRYRDAREFEAALRELHPTGEVFGAMAPSGLRLTTLPRKTLTSDAKTIAAHPKALRKVPEPARAGRRWGLWLAGLMLVVAIAGGAKAWMANDGGAAVHDGPALRFGITKYLPADMVKAALQPLLTYLSDELERPVELVVLDDYENLAQQFVDGSLDLAALSASAYIRAHELDASVEPVATPVRKGGNTDYEGYILVRASADLHTIEDLRGKVFCYVNPTSTSGYLYPRAVLRRAGLDPDASFSATRFGGDHLQTLAALYNGACDAAAVYATMWYNGGEKGMPPEAFRPVATTDRIPDDGYVISKGLDPAIAARLRELLLALEPGSALARRALVREGGESKQDIIGFIPADVDTYQRVREIVELERNAKSQAPADAGRVDAP